MLFFVSNRLQFGFKSGSSTTLCTGLMKSVVSRYLHNGSHASKAFDMVELFTRQGFTLSNSLFLGMLVLFSGDVCQLEFGFFWDCVMPMTLYSLTLSVCTSMGYLSESGVGCYWGHCSGLILSCVQLYMLYGTFHEKVYSEDVVKCSTLVRLFRNTFGVISPFEDLFSCS